MITLKAKHACTCCGVDLHPCWKSFPSAVVYRGLGATCGSFLGMLRDVRVALSVPGA